MADEATIFAGLQINKTPLFYITQPQAFKADVAGIVGPVPGSVLVTTEGVDIDFTPLVQPGLCLIQNLDDTNFVTYGIWDGVSFYPLGELLPGEQFPLRLSRVLGEEYGTGTGTSGAAINTLRFKADTDDVYVNVLAFEV